MSKNKQEEKKSKVFKLPTALWKADTREKLILVEDEDGVKWEFVIKNILPSDLIQIGKRMAVLRSGIATVSMDSDTNFYIDRQAHLEFAIVKHPKWFDIEDCPYSELLNYLYTQVWEWSESFKEGLKKNKSNKGVEKE